MRVGVELLHRCDDALKIESCFLSLLLEPFGKLVNHHMSVGGVVKPLCIVVVQVVDLFG